MKITAIRIVILGTEIEEPVRTSFGMMTHRHAILVEVRTDEGLSGWGESWSNFPTWSHFERIHTIGDGLAPLLLGEDPLEVARLHRKMRTATFILARQWGAPGPIAQAISALDIALWDLLGQARGQPIHELFGGAVVDGIPVYASALGPRDPAPLVAAMQARGVEAFKLKVGFGRDTDARNLERLRDFVGSEGRLMVDANQAWDDRATLEMAGLLERYRVEWLEEPLPADRWRELATLRLQLPVKVAAGENVSDLAGFRRLLELEAVDIAQPDVCKIGGLSEARAACQLAAAASVPFAPHYLGGAVGLVASLHLFAATAGGVIMELDSNPNPLREELGGDLVVVTGGKLPLPPGPGLGLVPDERLIRRYALQQRLVTA